MVIYRKHPKIANDALSHLRSALTEINFKQMMSLIDKCRRMPMVGTSLTKHIDNVVKNVTTDLNSFWRGIIPGTYPSDYIHIYEKSRLVELKRV